MLPLAAAIIVAALGMSGPAGAWVGPPDAAAIAHQGNGHGAGACSACHGADGAGQAAAGFPRLAALNATYLLRQLDAFANGTRRSAVMGPIAQALGGTGRKELAEYYSNLPVTASAPPAAVLPAAEAQSGERLAVRGRWSRQVPGCVQCHGPHGVGVGANFPPLAGQSAAYLASQLQAWKNGSRRNDPLGLMKHVASELSGVDIRAVSAWFARQPAQRKDPRS